VETVLKTGWFAMVSFNL